MMNPDTNNIHAGKSSTVTMGLYKDMITVQQYGEMDSMKYWYWKKYIKLDFPWEYDRSIKLFTSIKVMNKRQRVKAQSNS